MAQGFWRRRRKCEKFKTTTTTDNGQTVIRKALLSLWLRWAKKLKPLLRVSFLVIMSYNYLVISVLCRMIALGTYWPRFNSFSILKYQYWFLLILKLLTELLHVGKFFFQFSLHLDLFSDYQLLGLNDLNHWVLFSIHNVKYN